MNKHRFCLSIVPLALAMLFIVGCTKEKEDDIVPGLQLFEESMGGNAKVLVQNGDLLHNTWIVGEKIGFFGSSLVEGTVAHHQYNSYYVAYTPTGDFVSWYPRKATACLYGEHNDPTNADSVIITLSPALTMDTIFITNQGSSVQFPMVAFGNASSQSLMFRHVTGAITFWLKNTSGKTKKIRSMRVTATKNSNSTELYLWTSRKINTNNGNGLVCRPDTMYYFRTPNGSNNNNTDRFVFSSDTSDYYPLVNGDSVRITVPIPVTSVAANFQITFDSTLLDSGVIKSRTIKNVTIARNKLYDFPTFNLSD